jgi:cytochrome c553
MKKTLSIAAACILLGAAGAAHAGDAAAGKAKAATCAGCHGMDGNSMVPMYPKLAGQHEQYLTKALHAYKDGGRKDPTMGAMAAPLSDADIDNLAAYFAGQQAK